MPAFNTTDYNTGICDCFYDCSSCMEGCFCPWCFVSKQYNMFTTRDRSMDKCMCACSVFWDMCCPLGPACLGACVASCLTRNKAREQLGLTSRSYCEDCCVVFWCRPCADCQVYREMSLRNVWPGGICCVDKQYVLPGVVAPSVATMSTAGNIYAQPMAVPVQVVTFSLQPGQPAAAQPATGQPAMAQPATGQPAMAQPATGQPAMAQPATGQPAMAQPATGQPAMAQPVTVSGMGYTQAQPATAQPLGIPQQPTSQPAAAPPPPPPPPPPALSYKEQSLYGKFL